MAKLTDFTTPTGAKGNLLDVKSMWGLVLGTMVLIFAIGTGQSLANKVSGRVPLLDGTIEQPWQSPQVNNTPRKEVI